MKRKEGPLHAAHIANCIRQSLRLGDMNASVKSPTEAAYDFVRDMQALADRIDRSLETE